MHFRNNADFKQRNFDMKEALRKKTPPIAAQNHPSNRLVGSRTFESDRIVMKIAGEVEDALRTRVTLVLRSRLLQRVKGETHLGFRENL